MITDFNAMPKEADEQMVLIGWCDLHKSEYPELGWRYSSLNGEKRTEWKSVRCHAEGMSNGIPDLCFPFPSHDRQYSGLYIEMKRLSGSTLRPEQKVWLEKLREFGYRAEFGYGASGAATIINKHLGTDIEIPKGDVWRSIYFQCLANMRNKNK